MGNRAVSILKQQMQKLLKNFLKKWRASIIALVVMLAVLYSNVQSYAQDPTAAFVFQGGNGLRIGSGGSEGALVDLKRKETLNAGKILSVPGKSWVHLGFVIRDEKPDNPLVKVNKQERPSKYKFPCSGAGNFTIAWLKTDPKSGGKSQTCQDAKWQINREKYKKKTSATGFKQVFDSVLIAKDKQLDQSDSPQGASGLDITPGQNQTLIQTRSVGTFTFRDLGSCNLNTGKCTDRSGTVDLGTCSVETQRCTNSLDSVEDITVVDVLLGDVSVQPPNNPSGVPVKQGESYTYPGGEIKPIDVTANSNSCDIQQFVNPFYWNNPNVSKSVMDGIYEQLKAHREALGIAGRKASLSPLEQGVVDEMNLARTNPASYADFLEQGKQRYVQFAPKGGASAVNETIAFLRETSPRPSFYTSVGMSRASKDHAREQGSGHIGRDGSNMKTRLERYGSLGPELGCGIGENISYGLSSARDIVIQLIIDDFEPDRGHRKNIFNPDHQVVGVGCGSHAKYGSMCVIDYAGGYIERS